MWRLLKKCEGRVNVTGIIGNQKAYGWRVMRRTVGFFSIEKKSGAPRTKGVVSLKAQLLTIT
jgi:hypothetical protein